MILKLGTLPTQSPDTLRKPDQPKPQGFDFADLVKDNETQKPQGAKTNQKPNDSNVAEQTSNENAQQGPVVTTDAAILAEGPAESEIVTITGEASPNTEAEGSIAASLAVETNTETLAPLSSEEQQISTNDVSTNPISAVNESNGQEAKITPTPIAAPIEVAREAPPIEVAREAPPIEASPEELAHPTLQTKANSSNEETSKPNASANVTKTDVQVTNVPASKENHTKDALPKEAALLQEQLQAKSQHTPEDAAKMAPAAPIHNTQKPEATNTQTTDKAEVIEAPAHVKEVAAANTNEQNQDNNNNLPVKKEVILDNKLDDNQPPKFAHIQNSEGNHKPSNITTTIPNNTNPKPVLAQVSENITSLTSKQNIVNGETTTIIDLNPGDLGQVRVTIIAHDDIIREVKLSTKEPETLRLLQEGQKELAEQLKQVTSTKDASLQFNLQNQNNKQDHQNMLDFWTQQNEGNSGQNSLAPTKNSVYYVASTANAGIYNPTAGQVDIAL